MIYGRNPVLETLGGRRKIHRLLVAEGIREDERVRTILAIAAEARVEIERLDRDALDFLANTTHHQGVALVAGEYPYAAIDDIIGSTSGPILILDHIQDPQNFGTLLRTAEAIGVAGIVMPQDRAAAVTPAVVNSSSGAVEHQLVCRVPNLSRAIEQLKSAGWWVAGLKGGAGSVDLFTATIPEPVALVVGSEGTGISQGIEKHCDLLLSIPMVGRIASLNASTAGSIALYEVFRRQQPLSEHAISVD